MLMDMNVVQMRGALMLYAVLARRILVGGEAGYVWFGVRPIFPT